MNRKSLGMGLILTAADLGQIAAAWLLYDPQVNALIINLGWAILALSAVFGWLPIFTFRSRGEIKGRSYIHTTVLVDIGVYRVVRHPQYLAGVLLNIALPLITRHWLVVILGIIGMAVIYLNAFEEEKENLQKFGDAYRNYQEEVPRLNFLLGLFRLILRKRNQQDPL